MSRWESEPKDPWFVELIQYAAFILVAIVLFVALTATSP